MNMLDTVILGIIEGVTEFLPVSSTGHLIVASEWLSVHQTETHQAFEVIIQLAAILAVVANYRDKFTVRHFALWVKVALAFIPIGVFGLLFHKQVEALFTVPVVGTMFIIGGIIFLIVEHYYKETSLHTANAEDISYKQALWVGIAQISALIPGTSRAGASIVGGLLVGLSRKASAEFSFLLALPVIGAAAGFDLFQHYQDFHGEQAKTLIVGFITSFVVAYLSIKVFIRFLERFTFVGFGIYRILFGALLLWMAAG